MESGIAAPNGSRPGWRASNQRTKSAPARYGKMTLSRSHSGAWANSFIDAIWARKTLRVSQKLGSGMPLCSGIITRICDSVACPSSTACAAERRSFCRRCCMTESRFMYWS